MYNFKKTDNMKTHKYIILGLCLLLLGTTVSCEKGLNLYSKDAISEPVNFANAEDFKRYANNFYYGLSTFNSMTICPTLLNLQDLIM